MLVCVLQAITTMWESVHDEIEEATDLRAELHKHFTVDFMEQLFDAFPSQAGDDADDDSDDADVSAALLGLLGVMPATHAETLQQNMWNKLVELTPDTAQAGLTQVLNSLCRWGMGDQVWSRVLAGLRVAFGADVADESGAGIHPVVAVLAAEHLATTDCCGVWSDLLASSRAEPPAAGKKQGKGRKPTRDVRLQDLLDAFEFATTSMEMSMEEVGTGGGGGVGRLPQALTDGVFWFACLARVLQLFAGEQLSGEVSASDVGTDLAAPLALRAMCTLALLDAGHAGLEARKGADVPALSMPYTVVRLLVRGPVTRLAVAARPPWCLLCGAPSLTPAGCFVTGLDHLHSSPAAAAGVQVDPRRRGHAVRRAVSCGQAQGSRRVCRCSSLRCTPQRRAPPRACTVRRVRRHAGCRSGLRGARHDRPRRGGRGVATVRPWGCPRTLQPRCWCWCWCR